MVALSRFIDPEEDLEIKQTGVKIPSQTTTDGKV